MLTQNVIFRAKSILQQTGCLRYGRHDIFTFFQNVGLLLYYYLNLTLLQ